VNPGHQLPPRHSICGPIFFFQEQPGFAIHQQAVRHQIEDIVAIPQVFGDIAKRGNAGVFVLSGQFSDFDVSQTCTR